MEATKKKTASASYHHGDLRNALIIAAAQLIEESGSEDFAMIDAARRAGVSNVAPHRHLCDRNALLQAVGELGYYDLEHFVAGIDLDQIIENSTLALLQGSR